MADRFMGLLIGWSFPARYGIWIVKRRDQYRQYLKSEKWMVNRSYALERTSGFCQYCGSIATEVHHTKYPKQLGKEHPDSLIPVCKRCHNISHGIQEMKQLHDVTIMKELSPDGTKLNYLLSGPRVYASTESWARGLCIPKTMFGWFKARLVTTAVLNNDTVGDDLQMSYKNTAVYRWPAVAHQLREFDKQFYRNGFSHLPNDEQHEAKRFHEKYEIILNWGYALQERALAAQINRHNERGALVTQGTLNAPVTKNELVEAINLTLAPILVRHDIKLLEHDDVIKKIKNEVPVFRDSEEYISVKQAVVEKGFDGDSVPLHPKSKENLTGLAGRRLVNKNAEQGPQTTTRIDGQSISIKINTYRRRDIYKILEEISNNSS